jgi:hypothetical protein
MVSPSRLEEKGPLKRLTRAINSVNALAQSMRIQRGLGYSVRHTAHGQVIQLEDRRGTTTVEQAATIQRFEVTAIENDWVSCRKLKEDGTLDETDETVYKVAKPKELRVSTQNGATLAALGYNFIVSFPVAADYGNTRRLTLPASGSTPARYVDEVLLPAYNIGSELYATEPEDKTGVTVNDIRLTWLDINVDARQYRPKLTRVAVCVQENGQTVTRYMFVAGGPIQP